MRLALYQPDIPQNTGTMMRMCACLGVAMDIIEPCGFPYNDRAFRRAGLDYLDKAAVTRHLDWNHFLENISFGTPGAPRLILLSTKASVPHTSLTYRPDDILLLGQESCGAPDFVHEACTARVRIPMVPGVRSFNVAISAAMVLSLALTQTGGWPPEQPTS